MQITIKDAKIPVIANVSATEMEASEIKDKVNTTALFPGSMGRNVFKK